MNSWLRLDSGPCGPAFNMALDEALLEMVARLGQPVLRFYGWTEPAATFGYFQRFAEVERATHLRPLIRRPTGGGIVPHDLDWTYSAVFPPGHEWHSLKAVESYRRIHDWLRLAFAELDVTTELAVCSRHEEARPSAVEWDARKAESSPSQPAPKTATMTGRCFVGHEKYDLLWQGRKIAGAAQRRNRLGLLIQGSVQPPPVPLRRHEFEQAMRRVAGKDLRVAWTAVPPEPGLPQLADRLAREKYSQAAYNRKR